MERNAEVQDFLQRLAQREVFVDLFSVKQELQHPFLQDGASLCAFQRLWQSSSQS